MKRFLKQTPPARDADKKRLTCWWGTIVNVLGDVGSELQSGRVKSITITPEDFGNSEGQIFSGIWYRVDIRRTR